MGMILTILLGIAGACVGGLISSVIWPTWSDSPDVNRMWPGWLMSILGGVLVVWVYAYFAARRRLSA